MKKLSGRFLTITVSTAVLFSVSLFLTTCSLLDDFVKQPDVSFNSVNVHPGSFTLEGITLDCNVTITNPNSFNIPDIPDTKMDLYINGNYFIGSALPIGGGIEANKSADFVIPVKIKFFDFFETFKTFWKNANIDFKIALEIIIPLDYEILDLFTPSYDSRSVDLDGLLNDDKIVKWNIEKSGTFPLPQLPKLSSSFQLNKPNLSNGLGATVSMNFNNPNPFDLPAPIISFDYKMNNVSLLQSTTQSKVITASKTTTIDQKLDIPWQELVFKLPFLLTANNVNTSFSFNCDFGLEDYGESIIDDVISKIIPK